MKTLLTECTRDSHCPGDKHACNEGQHKCVGKAIVHLFSIYILLKKFTFILCISNIQEHDPVWNECIGYFFP